MMMIWFATLAFTAGHGDPSPAGNPADPRPTAPIARASAMATAPASTPLVRRPCRKYDGGPTRDSWAEDCDTEEGVEETWLIHLDALGADFVARIAWDRPASSGESAWPGRARPPSRRVTPLRC